jgi:hypothetical protein
MTEDASLDDFLGADDTESAAAEDDGNSVADGEEATDTSQADTVEPATTTYAWTGEGAACESCSEVVERRWQQAGALVCSACKDW